MDIYKRHAYLTGVQSHFELFKIKPFLCLSLFQIVIKISCTETKGVKFPVRLKQQ